MSSVKKKIVRNTAANTFMKLWRYAVNFFLFPFIIHHVGVEDYGLYLLVGARPNVIKQGPMSKVLQRSCEVIILYTGLHYGRGMRIYD